MFEITHVLNQDEEPNHTHKVDCDCGHTFYVNPTDEATMNWDMDNMVLVTICPECLSWE